MHVPVRAPQLEAEHDGYALTSEVSRSTLAHELCMVFGVEQA